MCLKNSFVVLYKVNTTEFAEGGKAEGGSRGVIWHKGRLLGFGLTKEIVKGELVIVPDLDSKFRRKFCFNFIQTPKMLLQKKETW